MNLMCIEPAINSGGITAFTSFTPEGSFRIHQLTKPEQADHYLNAEKFSHFCYDAFKSFPAFGDRLPFIWDVKILYELLGHKSESLIALGRNIFGFGRMERYVALSDSVKAHINSYQSAKIDIAAYEVVQLLPDDLFHDLYLERAKIVKDLFLRLSEEDKEFYKSFYNSVKLLYRISSEPLNIDLRAIESDKTHYAAAVRKNTNKNGHAYLKFNAVGAKTGRLGFKKGSMNVYTLSRATRSCIVAQKDHKIVEFDFKSFQPRLAIFLTESESFKDLFRSVEDIYSVFPGDRSKNKIAFLAWMYARSRISNEAFDKYAWPVWELRDSLAKKCKEEGFLRTKWGRKLYYKQEPNHIIFQNFITATEVDCILNVSQALVDYGIKVLLPFHDAVICEVPNSHLEMIPEAKDLCEKLLQSIFNAKFPVGVKVGNNLGNLSAASLEKVQKT